MKISYQIFYCDRQIDEKETLAEAKAFIADCMAVGANQNFRFDYEIKPVRKLEPVNEDISTYRPLSDYM